MLGQLALLLWSGVDAFRYARRTDEVSFRRKSAARRWLAVACAFAAGVAVSLALPKWEPTHPWVIKSESMDPTIEAGERIMADMTYYKNRIPLPGDLIVMKAPQSNDLYVKRVAAGGADSVEGKKGVIFVNGLPLKMPPGSHPPDTTYLNNPLYTFGPVLIPRGSFFVIGDNLSHSWDSRNAEFGFVGVDSIKGKALYIYWSRNPSRIGRELE